MLFKSNFMLLLIKLELKYKAAIESKKQAVDVELLRQRRVPSIFNIHLGSIYSIKYVPSHHKWEVGFYAYIIIQTCCPIGKNREIPKEMIVKNIWATFSMASSIEATSKRNRHKRISPKNYIKFYCILY